MPIVQCNYCMKKYEETPDHLITECSACSTDLFLMELEQEN